MREPATPLETEQWVESKQRESLQVGTKSILFDCCSSHKRGPRELETLIHSAIKTVCVFYVV